MTKFIVALSALLAAQAVESVVSTVQPQFLPLQNPGEEQCIVKNEFNEDDSLWTLKLGKCNEKDATLEFRHMGDGKELRTCDDFCLDTVKKSNATGVELVLRECPEKIKNKGLQWTQVGVNQWENGNKLCMEYNAETELFEQAECATLADDCEDSFQQWEFLRPPAIACMDWARNWQCAKQYALDARPGLTCVGGTGPECAQVCCIPANTCKSQGFTKCPVDYKPVLNRECNNYGQAPCSAQICCEYDPEPIKCNSWNKCSRGFELKPRAKDIWCTMGKPVEGPGYAPKCSDDICCDKTYEQTTCGRWNNCDAGFEVKPNSYNKRCYVPVYGVMPLHHGSGSNEWCSTNYCCQKKFEPQPPASSTCAASWTCDARSGRVPKPNAAILQCYPAAPGSLNPRCGDQLCCEQDTCKNWSQRVVEKKNNRVELTGEDVCRDNPAKYSGLMDRNDSRFTQPCMEFGRQVECKPELCCIQNVMPIL